MQLGFVLDQSRCIGCHACTVACKSENDVPVGSFRTWVKYTEVGTFPEVRRNFTVLRCNQCTNAPCVTICPVKALEKRTDGIVDVDHQACIGCKSCMQACPYDALYINPSTGTAQKCHFCAHRTDKGLAPACAVVCPTEAIIPGDFDDPNSLVSLMRDRQQLSRRKPEAGTGPNVLYVEAHDTGIDPSKTNSSGGYLWANQQPGPQLDAQAFEALETQAEGRTVYDVAHPPLWGRKVTNYVYFKSLAAGVFLAGSVVLPSWNTETGLVGRGAAWVFGLALLFLLLTTYYLISDLKRPERFLFILQRPNWDSWLTRGAVVLMAYGAALTGWLGVSLMQPELLSTNSVWLQTATWLTLLVAGLTACYTAWLFGQARGRVLWMKRGLWMHLLAQAGLAGAALLLLIGSFMGLGAGALEHLRNFLLVSLVFHLAWTLVESRLAPLGREKEYARASRLLSHGPYARKHWLLGVGLGILVPITLSLLWVPPVLYPVGALLALVGLYVEEDLFVRAGQALPIS